MDLGLKNLRALVTGASRGLGYATALGLAREGVTVAINSRDGKSLDEAAERITAESKVEVHALYGDLVDPDFPGKLVSHAAKVLGGLDLLVTNTGGPPSGPFESFDDEDWDHALDLVFRSHTRLIRAALPHLRESEAASVLTITSISVKQPVENLVLSNAGRAATVGLTKTLALELGPDGIRFNSILPASTDTQRIYELLEQRAKDKGSSLEAEIAAQSAASPFGRMAKAEEFANAAVFLLSPAASYITGVMLTVDGGTYKGTL
jgi:3-oxoacyl-[acyl-carrier protein] reductase